MPENKANRKSVAPTQSATNPEVDRPVHLSDSTTSSSDVIEGSPGFSSGHYKEFTLSISKGEHLEVEGGGRNSGDREARDDPEQLYVAFQTRGRCVVEQAGRTAVVEQDELVLYASSLPYTLRASGPFERVVVETSADRAFALSGVTPTSILLATPIVCRGVLSAVSTFFITLAENQEHDPQGAALVEPHADSLVAALLALAGPARRSEATIDQQREQALAHIRAHLTDPELDAHAVASSLGVSVRSLYRIFETTEHTPGRYLREIRIETARQLLERFPDRPVLVIAQQVGFNDLRSFYRTFNRITGQTPSQYRSQSRSS